MTANTVEVPKELLGLVIACLRLQAEALAILSPLGEALSEDEAETLWGLNCGLGVASESILTAKLSELINA
jgi:hypothetical protein